MAKFIRYEVGWELMWDVVRNASYEVQVFLSQSSRRWGEMIALLRALRNIGDVLETFYNLRFLRNDKVASIGSATGIRRAQIPDFDYSQSPVLVSFFFLGLVLVVFSS